MASETDIATLFAIRTSVHENHQSQAEVAAIGVTPDALRTLLDTTYRAWIAEVQGHAVAFSMADALRGTVFALFVHPEFEGSTSGHGWCTKRRSGSSRRAGTKCG